MAKMYNSEKENHYKKSIIKDLRELYCIDKIKGSNKKLMSTKINGIWSEKGRQG